MEDPVLQVITSTDRRGAEIFATDLEAALVERGRRVHTVALAPGWKGGSLDVPVLGRRRLALGALWRLRSAARRSAVVVAHGSTTLAACALATAGTGVPFVYRSIGDPEYWSATHLRELRVGAFLRRARAVVVLWPRAADLFSERFRLQPERIRSIPTGVPADRFPLIDRLQRTQARRQLGLHADRTTVAFIGALSSEKRVGGAIEAVGSLPDVDLVIAGDGPERDGLEKLAEAAAPGRARFLGVTGEPHTVLAAADVLVLPSSTEGLPAVLIEAGLSGVPVVASDVGGVREIVVEGATGLLVESGNTRALAAAIEAALRDPDRFSMRSRERCLERFEIGGVASAWDELLREVTDGA